MIAIIGMGVVGSAIYNSVSDGLLNSVLCFDESPKLKTFNSATSNDAMKADIIFVAVPTPTTDDGQDLSILIKILDTLSYKKYEGVIVINSTILEVLNTKYPKLKIVISPEFLNATTASEDFKNSKYIVLGGDAIHTSFVRKMYGHYFEFNNKVKYEMCTAQEAIDFKYLRNVKQAYNLMFWEFIQDQTGNSRKLANMLSNIPASENSISGLDGYRGYGQSNDKDASNFSACLDKDIRAWDNFKDHELLKFLKEYNKKIG